MNYFYLTIGILCAVAGLGILVYLMIPPASLRAKQLYNRQNPFNDQGETYEQETK
ncbi:hypothetical protein [Brevibacillus fulvus]|uniref:Uncharacterized protein n=1 Tax=Brevibacillus fulvus TaxID=1125967 RepID=A0A939BPQ5_9BACL|nr:hypothetical protein [Brevibacillus fulvus]MBM7590745.1 hypothetical protein [Brevibacillus fulvus]